MVNDPVAIPARGVDRLISMLLESPADPANKLTENRGPKLLLRNAIAPPLQNTSIPLLPENCRRGIGDHQCRSGKNVRHARVSGVPTHQLQRASTREVEPTVGESGSG